MPDMRVLAPKSLRDRIASKLEEGLRRNGEKEDKPNQTLHTKHGQAHGRRAYRQAKKQGLLSTMNQYPLINHGAGKPENWDSHFDMLYGLS
jgi:hypothetical protein